MATNTSAKLFRLHVGTRNVFRVHADSSGYVEDFKEAIQRVWALPFPASALDLYIAKKGDESAAWLCDDDDDLDLLQTSQLSQDIEDTYLNKGRLMKSTQILARYLDGDLSTAGVIHVLVDTRRAQSPSLGFGSVVRHGVVSSQTDSSGHWLARYRASRLTGDDLPSIDQLPSFIDQELATKIPLSTSSLAELRHLLDVVESPGLLDKIFVEDDQSPATAFEKRVVTLVTEAMDGSDTKNSFIPFWDMLIRAPLRFVFPDGCYGRDTNQHTSTRPDMIFTLHSVCVFRGDEHAAGVDIGVPREELRTKLLWIYGGAPYLFAYAASGYQCHLLALLRADTTNQVAVAQIGIFQLRRYADRFRFLLALLQLGRLFESIVSQCPHSARGEYANITRASGEVVRLGPTGVEKDFSLATERDGRPVNFTRLACHVEIVYKMLRDYRVPNVDQLVRVSHGQKRIRLNPRGLTVKPRTLAELFCARRCILEALVRLHGASWIHRDIRWPNVLKQREEDGNGWFLIDFLDAAPSPQENASAIHFNTIGHAPEMFFESGFHSTPVDLWSVGFLIEDCAVGEHWEDFQARTALKDRLMDDHPEQRPSAEDALEEVRRLESEFMNHDKQNATRTRKRASVTKNKSLV